MDKHPEVTTYLFIYGTNYARTDLDISPEVFRANMQQMIEDIESASRMPILAKIPRVLGDCFACQSYKDLGIDLENGVRNINIREYNVIIDQLATANGITVLPPDFYIYFKDTYGDAYSPTLQDGYADNLHPDGMGHKDMTELWWNVLIE